MTTDAGEVLATGFSLNTDAPSGEGFGDSPLRKFRGRGTGFYIAGGRGKDRPGPNGTVIPGNLWQRPHFQFTELEVLALMPDAEPYNMPTADISVFYSDPTKTPKRRAGEGINEWEALCESMRGMGLEGMAAFNEMFGSQVTKEGDQPTKPGLMMTWERLPTLTRVGPDAAAAEAAQQAANLVEANRLKSWHDEVRLLWRVVEVEGHGTWSDPSPPTQAPAALTSQAPAPAPSGPSIVDVLAEIANGKTEDQFYSAASDDARVVANPGIVAQLANKTVVATLEQMMKVSKDPITGVLTKL